MEGKFTPGQISNTIARLQLNLKVDDGEFIANILNNCNQNIEAGFGEGYWSDHWDYNMDLVDNYLSVFPDKKDQFCLEMIHINSMTALHMLFQEMRNM